MYFAFCPGPDWPVLLLLMLLLFVVPCVVFVLAVIGIVKLIEAWRRRTGATSLPHDAVPPWPENVP